MDREEQMVMKTWWQVGITILVMVRVASAQPRAPAPSPAFNPADLAGLAKGLEGRWNCTGNEWDSPSSPKSPMKATATIKLDFDNSWLVETWSFQGRTTSNMVAYTMYDTAAPTGKLPWWRYEFRNGGSGSGQFSISAGKISWTRAKLLNGPRTIDITGEFDLSDLKTGMKVKGGMNETMPGGAPKPGGKTWNYEMVCTNPPPDPSPTLPIATGQVWSGDYGCDRPPRMPITLQLITLQRDPNAYYTKVTANLTWTYAPNGSKQPGQSYVSVVEGTYVPDARHLLLSTKQGGIQPATNSLTHLSLGVRLSDDGLTATGSAKINAIFDCYSITLRRQ
jgi:hypothetical protein